MKGFNGIANAKISSRDARKRGFECVDRLTGLKWTQCDSAR